ncbi:MAG: FAD-dependent oxidoreductase [Candidatus Omnitrophica bacterium]|nr:FAD-dependent oxidoreductase [Candidatus Omnitrophota bacterium]
MKHICIIGNSAAAVSCVEAIRSRDKDSKITLISDEEYPAYCRCLITSFVSGEVLQAKLRLRPEDFYKENSVDLALGKKVIKLDPKKRRLTLLDNSKLDFDIALIATGARSKLPETKGIKREGVSGFRTLNDAKDIISIAVYAKAACILGGGLIGLKAAYALKRRGLSVKVLIKSKQVMSQVLDEEAASIVGAHLENQGIEILTGEEAVEIIGNGQVRAVKLSSGKIIESAIVIVGKGVSPNIELVKQSGINTNFGILTNEYLQTNVEGVFAAGDVAETFDVARGASYINALWPNAVEQGRIAGSNIRGEKCAYSGSVAMNSVDFFALPVISIGLKKEEEDCETLRFSDKKNSIYKKFIIKDNILKGFIGVGKIENSGIFLRLIRERTDISSIKTQLLADSFSYAKVIDLFGRDEVYLKK